MKQPEKRQITINYTIYHRDEDGPAEIIKLMKAAESVCRNAYAPYSGFRVGAAVMMEDGTIVTGSNQENAAYPSGLCAERVALFSAASQFPGQRIRMMAVAALNKNDQQVPVTPCGSCRQVMLEYEYRQVQPIEILLRGQQLTILHFGNTESLLPLGFNKTQLK